MYVFVITPLSFSVLGEVILLYQLSYISRSVYLSVFKNISKQQHRNQLFSYNLLIFISPVSRLGVQVVF